MNLSTRSGTPFLAINGIQTLSHTCLNLSREISALQQMGVGAFRLSPHSTDMVAVADCYRRLLDGEISADEADTMLEKLNLPQPMANGFFHRQPGYKRVAGSLLEA